MTDNNTELPEEVFEVISEMQYCHMDEIVDGVRYQKILLTDWKDEGKYQYQAIIYKQDDKYMILWITRSGSYFSDYYFQYEKPNEVSEKDLISFLLEEGENLDKLIDLILEDGNAKEFLTNLLSNKLQKED